MKRFTKLSVIVFVALSATGVSAQKGVDTQTQKIRDDAGKTTSRTTDATRTFDWGKDKTKTRERLANPYQLNGRRDGLVMAVQNVLREKKMVIDEAASRPNEGIIITQPFIIGRGQVIATTELKRYGNLAFGDDAWSRGQFSLIIEVQPIDGMRNNISVTAKVEGRSARGLSTEWVTVPSSGLAEEQFLVALVESVTGISPDDVLKPDPDNQ
ncbi:MAG: hypothetical protein KF685_01040 [Acidobacteria bacterium]|nr:hypothetical protein [Acidobacteriota bacterium]